MFVTRSFYCKKPRTRRVVGAISAPDWGGITVRQQRRQSNRPAEAAPTRDSDVRELVPRSSRAPVMGMGLVALDQAPFVGLPEAEIRALTVQMLARELNTGRVVTFVGSGVSQEYGYPSWQTFVKALAGSANRLAGESCSASRVIERFLELASDVAGLQPMSPEQFLVVLDACQELYERHDGSNASPSPGFQAAVRAAMEPKTGVGTDPLRALIQLGIRRFVTTNYDSVIESALKKHGGCDTREDRIGRRAHSLGLSPGNAADLIQFAVDAPGYRYGVWHCHGDLQSGSPLIVTTRDYQQHYFSHGHDETSSRQAMELILTSNPTLFVGYGMREPEVLRPLREFLATRRRGKPERPLFSLMRGEDRTEADRAAYRRQLYATYGVKVIWYEEGDLETAITHLDLETREWWRQWRKKPPVRKANFGLFGREKRVMIHHKEAGHPPQRPNPADQSSTKSPERRRPTHAFDGHPKAGEIYELIAGEPGVLFVLGNSGHGKGRLAANLAQHWSAKRAQARVFLATCRFSNDFLSILDAACRHFTRPRGSRQQPANSSARAVSCDQTPLQRVQQALDAGSDDLFILGGVERLLTPVRPADTLPSVQGDGLRSTDRFGVPLTTEIAAFLRLVQRSKCRVVLLGTLFPTCPGFPESTVKLKHLDALPRSTVRKAYKKWHIESSTVDQLYSLLDGHAYALAALLASISEQAMDHARAVEWLDSIIARLSSSDPTHRAERALSMIIETVCGIAEANTKLLVRHEVLHCVALATTPVDAYSIAVALEGDPEHIEHVISDLCQMRLLIEIEPPDNDPTLRDQRSLLSARYTAHTLVRKCVLHAAGSHALDAAEPQRFVLPCYSNEAEEMQQVSPAAQKMVAGCVERLLRELETSDRKRAAIQRRHVARAAFGMIRARWSAVGLSQLAHLEADEPRTHYEEYQLRLFRLCNAIRMDVKPQELWDQYHADREASDGDDGNGIFYADELAWIYNELGLVSYIRGLLGNAQSLWLQGLEINKIAESGLRGPRWRQSMLNLAIVQIERARLHDAERSLETILQSARNDGDRNTTARTQGFLGWISHLRGDDPSARAYYDAAIAGLHDVEVARGKSLFLRYLGDLNRRSGDYDAARKCLDRSIAVAEHGRHLDLVNWTRLSEAALALSEGRTTAASGVEDVLAFAVRMGIQKLEAAALQARAEAALRNGDLGHADTMARRSLAIASGLGMQLRLIGTIMILGRIARARGDSETARHLLLASATLGRRHGYQLRVEQAERELRHLPRPTG